MRKRHRLVSTAQISDNLKIELYRLDVTTLRHPLGDDSKTEYWVMAINGEGRPYRQISYGSGYGLRRSIFRYRPQDFVIPEDSWAETPLGAARRAAIDKFLTVVAMLGGINAADLEVSRSS